MEISAKNQIRGIVTSVIHGQSYSQVAVEQTDADQNPTGSFIHAAIPVDICKKKKMELKKRYSCNMYFSCGNRNFSKALNSKKLWENFLNSFELISSFDKGLYEIIFYL